MSDTSDQSDAPQARKWCVAGAMRMELAPLRAKNLPNLTYLETGVGPRNAERTTRRAFAENRPVGVIHIGFAGALSASFVLNDVIIAEHIGGILQAPVDGALLTMARELRLDNVRIYPGIVLTFDRILVTAAEKQTVAKDRSANELACVDMESAAVASICAEFRIPYLGIRCISDTFNEDLPLDLNRSRDSGGNVNSLRVVMSALSQPKSFGGLLEMRRRSVKCAEILARVVEAVVTQMPSCNAT